MRVLTYSWVDLDGDKQPDCDPAHPASSLAELPPEEEVPCKQCTKGMQRDSHGNCEYCPIGTFQPLDLEDGGHTPVSCEPCAKGTFAETIFDQKEFEKIPEWLDRQKCSTVTATASTTSCLVHQRKWRTHLNTLRPDTGIPEGLRISIGGNMRVGNELGGTMTVEFETYRLRAGEAFLIFIDSQEVLSVRPGEELDEAGFSVQRSETHTFDLKKGEHLIQFSVESRIEPALITSYWDT